MTSPITRYIRRILWLLAAVGALVFARAEGEVSPQRLVMLRGAIALIEENNAAALTDLQDAATMAPEDWQCQLLYGQALLKAGQAQEAQVQLRRVLLLAPLNIAVWQTVGTIARATGDTRLELTVVSGLLRLTPEDPLLLQQQAALCRQLNQSDEAAAADTAWQALLPPLKLDYAYPYHFRAATLAELRALVQDDKENSQLLEALAAEEWKANNHDAARTAMRQAYVLSPRDVTVIRNYAHMMLLDGQVDEALTVLKAAAPLGDYAADRALALWSLATGRHEDAAQALKRLLTRNPIDAVLNRLLGITLLTYGSASDAVAALRIAWLREHHPLTGQLYADALLTVNRKADAEELLKQAITLFPRDVHLKLSLSLLCRDAGRLLECADLTTELARTHPERIALLILAGERYFQAGYVQRTLNIATLLRDDFPQDRMAVLGALQLFRRISAFPDARLTLARYLGPATANAPLPMPTVMLLVANNAIADNQLAEAEMALKDLLRVEPSTREAYVQLGSLYLQQERWTDARYVYAAAAERWKDDLAMQLALARAALQEGNYPLAIAAYQRAAELTPAADPWLELGILYHRQGDEDHALDCWRTALDRPGGQVRARLHLLAGYERADDAKHALEMLTNVLDVLERERQARAARWHTQLTARGLSVAPAELNALLLLAPDLTDPAPLRQRRDLLLATLNPAARSTVN